MHVDQADFSKITHRSSLHARWACLLAALVAEVLAISLRYDSAAVSPDRALFFAISHSGDIVRLAIVIGLATCMVVVPRWYGFLTSEATAFEAPSRPLPWIAANLFAFFLFYHLSARVLEGTSLHDSNWPSVLAWGTSGAATLLFWAAAVLPLRLWGPLLRRSGWGLAVGPALGAIASVCGLLARNQWEALSQATLRLVAIILNLVFRDAVCQPELHLVGTRSYSVQIAPECSGYEGVGMIVALLAISLWLLRRDFRFPRALFLLPAGAVLIWLANALRIATLVALGTFGYSDVAEGGFHSLAGWAFLMLIGLGVIAAARQSRYFSTLREHEADSHRHTTTLDGAYLVPAMAIIATAMVTVSLSPGFDLYYPARVIAATAALIFYRKSYSELRLRWSWAAGLIGLGVFALWMAIEPHGSIQIDVGTAPSSLAALSPVWSVTWLAFRVAGSVLTVPLAEELAFRGYLTRRLIAANFQKIAPGQMTLLSFVVSSLLFGALHGRWFAGTLAGMAYALAYRRRGELADAVLAHAVTNALIAITVLATGRWSLWS